jgi:opacity protein-like surface antigen
VSDGAGGTATGTVEVTVSAVNDAPVASDDTASIIAGSSVALDVLANDQDVDGDTLVVTAVNGTPIAVGGSISVEGGTVSLTDQGKLVFVPTGGFVGSVSFDYTATDLAGASGVGTVNVSVGVENGTLVIQQADIDYVVAHASQLSEAGVEHIDIGGADHIEALSISGDQAAALIGAGLDFAASDNITLNAAGTHLSTSLSALASLGVDAIDANGAGHLELAAGGLGGLAGKDLPSFILPGQDDASLDVTLDIAPGELEAAGDLGALASHLAALGVDHLDIGGSGTVGSATLSEAQAAALIGAGLDFAASDNITLNAAGTHLSTSLSALNHLGVDHIEHASELSVEDVQAQLDQLSLGSFFTPDHFTEQDDALLIVDNDSVSVNDDLGYLLGIDFLGGDTQADDFGRLIHALQRAGVEEIDIQATNHVEVDDQLAAALIEAGMLEALPATNLEIDATASSIVETSLAAMAQLGVDQVRLSGAVDTPVYVDLGIEHGATSSADLLKLFEILDADHDASTPLFVGATNVALVVDTATADVIRDTAGAFDALKGLGVTELAVVGAPAGYDSLFTDHTISVKLIGDDDDPFHHQF